MRVVVNGEERTVSDGADVATLVESLGLAPDGIAVAVDQTVVPRGRWTERSLAEGDRVEIVTAMQGG